LIAKIHARQIGQFERVIKLAHHKKAAVGTELRSTKFHPYTRVKIDPICPRQARTRRLPH
jgi:hypothetical protein